MPALWPVNFWKSWPRFNKKQNLWIRRIMCHRALSGSWKDSPILLSGHVCIWPVEGGLCHFPLRRFMSSQCWLLGKGSGHIYEWQLSSGKGKWQILDKKYGVNFSPWRAKEIIRATWQPQSPGTGPASWLSHCHLYEPGQLSSSQGGTGGIYRNFHMAQEKETSNLCLLKFWVSNCPPIVYN